MAELGIGILLLGISGVGLHIALPFTRTPRHAKKREGSK